MNLKEFRQSHEKRLDVVFEFNHPHYPEERYVLLQDTNDRSLFSVHHYFKMYNQWQVSYDIRASIFLAAYQYLVKEGIQ